jgi:long-chain-acyl-CoA dehydrogenase
MCIEQHSVGALSNETASMSKYWATELENRIAEQCVQLHGGMGFMWDCSISRAYCNARVQTIYGGTNEIMKELISRSIVKKQK